MRFLRFISVVFVCGAFVGSWNQHRVIQAAEGQVTWSRQIALLFTETVPPAITREAAAHSACSRIRMRAGAAPK